MICLVDITCTCFDSLGFLTTHSKAPLKILEHAFFFKFIHIKPEALKSLYRSPGYKKNQLVLCKNYVLQ